MTRNRYAAVSADVAARMIGGEMMVMSMRDSTLFVLNRTAAALWDAADGSTRLADIVERRISADYDVDADVALRDAEELVEQLAGHGLLLLSDEPAQAGRQAENGWRQR